MVKDQAYTREMVEAAAAVVAVEATIIKEVVAAADVRFTRETLDQTVIMAEEGVIAAGAEAVAVAVATMMDSRKS